MKFIYKWKFTEFPFKNFFQVLTTMFDNNKGNPQIIGDIFASLGMKVPDGKNGPYRQTSRRLKNHYRRIITVLLIIWTKWSNFTLSFFFIKMVVVNFLLDSSSCSIIKAFFFFFFFFPFPLFTNII